MISTTLLGPFDGNVGGYANAGCLDYWAQLDVQKACSLGRVVAQQAVDRAQSTEAFPVNLVQCFGSVSVLRTVATAYCKIILLNLDDVSNLVYIGLAYSSSLVLEV